MIQKDNDGYGYKSLKFKPKTDVFHATIKELSNL